MYNPRSWYWLADDGRLFSSSKQTPIVESDADYLAWTAAGFKPSAWPRDDAGEQTDAALQEVLLPYSIFVNLYYYAADVRWLKETSGIDVSGRAVMTHRISQTMTDHALSAVTTDPTVTTIKYKYRDGFETLTPEQMTEVAKAVHAHVQLCFTTEADVAAAIDAGTITTREQIDAAFAAITGLNLPRGSL